MSKPAYTRKDLERVIDEGGSVLHRGQLIVSKDQLPTEADIKAAHEGKERVEAPAKTKPANAPENPPGGTGGAGGTGNTGGTGGTGGEPPKE